MSIFRRRVSAPPAVLATLDKGELVLGLAREQSGADLAVTRHRLVIVGRADGVTSLGWFEIAKARLSDGVLEIVPLRRVGTFAGGAGDVVVDGPALFLRIDRPNRLTDQIHQRVRSSVVASRQVPWPGAGGWVTIRRVAGADGVLPQLRLDDGADAQAPGFLAACEQVVLELRAGGVTNGTTGVDE